MKKTNPAADQAVGPKMTSPHILRASILLPYKLPTWNAVLAMPLSKRMRVKKLIRDSVSQCIRAAGGSRTPMGSALNGLSTDWSKADSYRTTRRSTWKRSRSRKKKATLRTPALT